MTAPGPLRSCGKIRLVTTSHQANRWYVTATRLYSDHGRLSWPATELEIRDASLQFVRKLSGFSVPSRTNEVAFEQAVAEVADGAATRLQPALCTMAPTRDAAPARTRSSSNVSTQPENSRPAKCSW